MKKLLLALSATTIVAILLVATSCLPTTASVVVTEDDMDQAYVTNDGIISRQITINSGDSFKVTLYAHWSAGMKWSVSYSEPGIVRVDSAREFINDGPPNSFGSPGREYWTFKALDTGTTTVIMTYSSVANLPDATQNVNTLKLVVEVKDG